MALSRTLLLFASTIVGSGVALAAGCGTDEGATFQDDGGASGGASGTSGTSGGASGGFPGQGGDGSTNGGLPDGAPACATATAAAARQPVYLHIVLDRSRSMDGHGNKTDGTCDPGQTVPAGSTCFLAGEREPDPLDPGRTIEVCHNNGQASTTCPSFVGLTGKKWIAARGALTSFFDTAATAADARMGIGMFLFDGGTRNDSPWRVAPSFVGPEHATALKETVLPPSYATAGGTPLRAALTSQSAALRTFQPAAPLAPDGKRVLVVMTDGTPGDCGGDRNLCVDDVAALVTAEVPINTFVIGIGDVDDAEGSVYDEKFLSRLANAGGAAPAGCNPAWDGQNPVGEPCHFQVTPGARPSSEIRDDMIAAFTQIAARVQSCELTLDQTAEIDPAKVNVVYTDTTGETQVLPGTDGWTYDDPAAPTKVILGGAACERLKADPDATVRIVIGCPTGTAVVN